VTLKRAREKRDDARRLIADGIDPSAKKQPEKQAGADAPIVVTNHAAVTDPKKVGELLRAIHAYSGQPATEAAFKLAPLLFVRPGELRAARWEEFELDGDSPEWRIPAERMKMGELHIVPPSKQAVSVLRDLHPVTGPDGYVFPSLTNANRPMSENALTAALRRMGYSGQEMTWHGFRTIASTLLNEQGWHPDLIELQLAHRAQCRARCLALLQERVRKR
jgi:integrase